MVQDEPVKSDYVALGFEKIDRDLAFLIGSLAEVLTTLGHADLAALLPWTGKELPSDIDRLPAQTGLVFSIAFQLLNLVEENAAAQMRSLRETELGVTAEPGLWGQALANLRERGFGPEQIASRLNSIRIEPVLTAHPTEAKRLSVLDQHRALYQLIQERERSHLTPADSKRLNSQTRAALERLWRTGEILLSKPDLSDERRNVLYYLRDVFPSVLPRLQVRLRSAWESVGFEPGFIDARGKMPRVRFGTWVGGDRDGHPGVTPEVTAETLERLRVNSLIVIHRELTRLTETLTLSGWMQPLPPAMAAAQKQMVEALGRRPSTLPAHADEPWRDFVGLMIELLPLHMAPNQLADLREEPGTYLHPTELEAHLWLLHDSLVEIGASRLAALDVRPAIRAVETFGFHLADLDIRQNSAFHDKAVGQLLTAAGLDGNDFGDWPEHDRLSFLERELRSPRPFLHANASAGPEADSVLGCFRVLARHIEKYGTNGIGALIVSMTKRQSDLLVVYLLAREAGLTRYLPEGLTCLRPIVPLFETISDLESAPGILRGFLDHPVTRSSLRFQQGGVEELMQQVMVGYSDSNKDAGILASQWALHQGQTEIAAVAAEAGVSIQFFHGRGGTVSRGAGPTNRFLEALPPGSLCGDIRLTEQGESIAQKYGTLSVATYNLELLLAGVTSATLSPASNAEGEAALMEICPPLSEASEIAYRKLLEAPGFIEFYRQATPIDALEHARIGSRPSRRTGQASLADLRAIPWVFSWNQSRFYVPGWFGVGSGLQHLADQHDSAFRAMRDRLRSSPFLYYVLTNVESSIASTDLDLMRAYAGLVENEEIRTRIFNMIWEEWTRTRAMLQELRGQPTAQRRPRMLKTLQLRAEALRLLHLDQIRLLSRWRAARKEGHDAEAEAMLPELFLSVNAIASGLRTTG
jgi:phosphoenolpyruvate carboxylase